MIIAIRPLWVGLSPWQVLGFNGSKRPEAAIDSFGALKIK